VLVEANPGNPALCLSLPAAALSRKIPIIPGTPGLELRQRRDQATIGKSNYNALELSLRHTSGRLDFSAGYTYSKSMDNSSSLGEQVNPVIQL